MRTPDKPSDSHLLWSTMTQHPRLLHVYMKEKAGNVLPDTNKCACVNAMRILSLQAAHPRQKLSVQKADTN